jgi:predicted MFS family arabinose efflux permease
MYKKNRIFTPSVIALILLSFILGTSEFIVIGILPDISRDLNVSLSVAGRIVSIFALTYAVGTPIVTACTSNTNRYKLLLLMNIIFILGNFISAVTPSYSILVISRILTAVVSGTIISLSMTFTSDVAVPENRGKVVAWIFSGFSIASIVGVPAGTFLSHLLGWHSVFLAICIVSGFVTFFLACSLPRQCVSLKSNMMQQLLLIKDSRIQLGFLIPMFGAAATYVFYTYLTPIFETKLNIDQEYIGILLLVFGVCSIISNLLSGKIAASNGMKRLHVVFILQTILLVLLPISFSFIPAGLTDIFALGVVMYLMNSPVQIYFLDTAALHYPTSVNLASSISPVAFNFGISLGSLTGSFVVAHVGFTYLGVFGSFFSFAAFLVIYCLKKRTQNFSSIYYKKESIC